MKNIFQRLKKKMNILNSKKTNFQFFPLSLKSRLTNDPEESKKLETIEINKLSNLTLEEVKYPGEKIVVYNKHINSGKKNSQYYYHIAWCKHLKKANENGSYGQYFFTRRSDEKFLVNIYKNHKLIEKDLLVKMSVCKDCLREINYKGYGLDLFNNRFINSWTSNKSKKIYDSFTLEEYFKEYNSSIEVKPTRTSRNKKANEYPENWDKISYDYRASTLWKCEACGLDCSKNKSYLDAHHLNGIKYDTQIYNLKALCKECHDIVHSKKISIESIPRYKQEEEKRKKIQREKERLEEERRKEQERIRIISEKKEKEKREKLEKERLAKEREKEAERKKIEAEKRHLEEERRRKQDNLTREKQIKEKFKVISNKHLIDYKALFKYYPTRYKVPEISIEDEANRNLVFAFKDGRYTDKFVSILSDALKVMYSKEELRKIVLLPIPASTANKTQNRYEYLLENISELTGIVNGYTYIRNTKDMGAKHIIGEETNLISTLDIDNKALENRHIILLDDVITRGNNLTKLSTRLKEESKVSKIEALFLAKTTRLEDEKRMEDMKKFLI